MNFPCLFPWYPMNFPCLWHHDIPITSHECPTIFTHHLPHRCTSTRDSTAVLEAHVAPSPWATKPWSNGDFQWRKGSTDRAIQLSKKNKKGKVGSHTFPDLRVLIKSAFWKTFDPKNGIPRGTLPIERLPWRMFSPPPSPSAWEHSSSVKNWDPKCHRNEGKTELPVASR